MGSELSFGKSATDEVTTAEGAGMAIRVEVSDAKAAVIYPR